MDEVITGVVTSIHILMTTIIRAMDVIMKGIRTDRALVRRCNLNGILVVVEMDPHCSIEISILIIKDVFYDFHNCLVDF